MNCRLCNVMCADYNVCVYRRTAPGLLVVAPPVLNQYSQMVTAPIIQEANPSVLSQPTIVQKGAAA